MIIISIRHFSHFDDTKKKEKKTLINPAIYSAVIGIDAVESRNTGGNLMNDKLLFVSGAIMVQRCKYLRILKLNENDGREIDFK